MTPLEAFTLSYMNTALWSSNDESDDSGGNPMDENYGIEDFADETRRRVNADCEVFYESMKEHIHCDDAPLSSEIPDSPIMVRQAAMAGHDFWLTRNGHGVGFWDGYWPEPHGDVLYMASAEFVKTNLYVGDDGKIYQE